jgi:hypothetical protein
MRGVGEVIGVLGFVVVAGYVPTASAQGAPEPNIGLELTETLNRIDVRNSVREDLRDVPPPRADKLSDNVRITVTVGDPRCYPGEDGWVAPPPPRGITRPVR